MYPDIASAYIRETEAYRQQLGAINEELKGKLRFAHAREYARRQQRIRSKGYDAALINLPVFIMLYLSADDWASRSEAYHTREAIKNHVIKTSKYRAVFIS
jgi:hypothetical protein